MIDVKQNESTNPLNISFFGAVAIVMESKRVLDLYHELFGHCNLTLPVARNISNSHKRIITDLHRSSPNFTADLHNRLIEEIIRSSEE